MRKTIILLLLILLIPAAVWSEFRVKLKIPDQKLHGARAKSYLTRELLSLGDVILVDTREDFLLGIIAQKNVTPNGDIIGYSLATYLSTRVPGWFLIAKLIELGDLTTEQVRFINQFTEGGVYLIEEHRIDSGGPKDLKDLCEKIITLFDLNYLNKRRQSRDRM